jgi:hypothetical protein
VKVTGPAGTLVVSSAQPSLPPLLAIVTLTALVPPGFEGLELLFEWLHAVTENTATATKVGAVNQNSRDRRLTRAARITINRFPFLFGSRAVAAHRGDAAKSASQRKGA